MDAIDFLIRAENYAYARGDMDRFVERYAAYREYVNVKDSAWLTIKNMYGEEFADLLEQSNIVEVK
jgi:hypothetical protein